MRTPIRILTALVSTATLAVALPAVATARPVLLTPPGNSGVTQYAEVVPTDQGATPPRPGGGSGGAAVTLSQQRGLSRLGADGRTLAAVTKATAPPAFSSGNKSQAASSTIVPRALSTAGARSAFASIVDAALGPVGGALGAVALAGGVALVARGIRRRRADS